MRVRATVRRHRRRRAPTGDSKGKKPLNRVVPVIRALAGDAVGWQTSGCLSRLLLIKFAVFMGIAIGWAAGICIGPWHEIRTWHWVIEWHRIRHWRCIRERY